MKLTYEDLGQQDYYSPIEKKGCKELKGKYFNLLFYVCDGVMRAQHYEPFTEEIIREVIVENSKQVWFEVNWYNDKEQMMKKVDYLFVD